MALIKLGNMVQDTRGSLNGTVFSRNKGGAYARTKVSPVQPRTPAQLAVRANFAANSKLWTGELSDSQRAAWVTFAATYPYTNVFGDSSVLTGMAMMMRKNQLLLQSGNAIILDPPVDNSVTAIAAATGATASSTTNEVKVDTDAQSAFADTEYYVFATGPLPAGINPSENRYRFIGSYQPSAAAVTIDLTDDYTAVFGEITNVNVGQKVWVIVAQLSASKGNLEVGTKLMAIVS